MLLLWQARGPLSAQAALARGNRIFCSASVSMLLGSAFAVPCKMCEAWAMLWAVQGGVDVVS